MRAYPLIIFLAFSSLVAYSQNIEITFSGTSSAVFIDNVNATNLTTGETISLPGDATLLLSPKTGISDNLFTNDISVVYPNPFPGQSTTKAFINEPGKINLILTNLSGQFIAQKSVYLEPGEHSFFISLSKPGIYFATLETKAGTKTYKLVNTASSASGNQIELTGSNPQHTTRNSQLATSNLHPTPITNQLKSSFSLGFSAGDTIQYQCFSGEFSTDFIDSPMESKNYEVEFPPIAAFTIEPGEGTIKDRLTLDAEACIDAETPSDELEVRWDFDEDGIWDTDFDKTKIRIHMIPKPGSYNIWLQVRDQAGLTDSTSFTINISYLYFTDTRDGNVYHYKDIGDQVWMVENLAYLPEVSPTTAESKTEKHYYVYGNVLPIVDSAKANPNYMVYGVLYNWPAAMEACPEGWHLPSDDEWKDLEIYLGMNLDDVHDRPRDPRLSGSVGGQLKEEGKAHWNDPNTGATNSTGFTALPAGQGGLLVLDGPWVYAGIGAGTFFWTSTAYVQAEPHAYYRGLSHSSPGVTRFVCWTSYGFSVRCIRD